VVPRAEGRQFGVLEVGDADRITGFQEKPPEPVGLPGAPGLCLASMGVYAFAPGALLEALASDAADPTSLHDFGRDLVPRLVAEGRACAFDSRAANRSGSVYWRDVGTLDAYYEANMDLVAVSPAFNLYDADWPVRFAPPLAPPPKFVHSEPDRTGVAIDSLVSPGTIVSGARVVHSVVGPWVRLHGRARVEDAVLFEGVDVGSRAWVRRAILDDGVRVPPDERIGYDLDRDRVRFVVTEPGVVVVSREAARQAWPA
jgi:glucose-1-phosphate adenylyltransferase